MRVEDIGALTATFEYHSAQRARVAMAAVADQTGKGRPCAYISVNSWATLDATRWFVTVLTEVERRPAFNRARRICRAHGGRPADHEFPRESPQVAAQVTKRARMMLATPQGEYASVDQRGVYGTLRSDGSVG